jgi:hypothetical protein
MPHIMTQSQDYLGMKRGILCKKYCHMGRINIPQGGAGCTNQKGRERATTDVKHPESPSKGNLLQEIPHATKILGSSGRVSKFCVIM